MRTKKKERVRTKVQNASTTSCYRSSGWTQYNVQQLEADPFLANNDNRPATIDQYLSTTGSSVDCCCPAIKVDGREATAVGACPSGVSSISIQSAVLP